jgi:Fe2+ or Zn2+ uptake regulation protein
MAASADTMLVTALRARGGRVTPQRLAIAQLIRELDGHATAEEIFGQLTDRLPGVSRPTVYATLELLEELGQVVRVPAGSGAVLFDPRTDHHDHMICRQCGAVSDLDSVVDVTPAAAAAGREGFAAEDAQLVVRGLCADCKAAAAPSP